MFSSRECGKGQITADTANTLVAEILDLGLKSDWHYIVFLFRSVGLDQNCHDRVGEKVTC